MNNISSVVITLMNPNLCEEVATKIDEISNCEVAAKENDKIVYKRNNKVFINKVVNEKMDNIENQLCVINNNEKVSINDVDVVAKVLCTTKGFGNMAMFIKSPIGMLNMLLIALCIVIIIKKIISNKQEQPQIQTIETEKVIDDKEIVDNKDVNDESKKD